MVSWSKRAMLNGELLNEPMHTFPKFFLALMTGIFLLFPSSNVLMAQTVQKNGTFGNLEVGLPGIPAGESIDTLVKPGSKPILTFINQAVDAAIAILVIIGLISITIGGYLYMTAAGNGERVKTAKEWILAALVGIFLALVSVIILTTINNYLGKDAQEPQLGPVEGSAGDSPSSNVK